MLDFRRVSPLSMQRASQIIGQITAASKRYKDVDPLLDAEQVAMAAWDRAVGKKIAQHTRVRSLVRGKLIVETGEQLWQRNLFFMSQAILRKVQAALGPNVVTDIEFRCVPARKEPQRAEAVTGAAKQAVDDDAERITDPGLRRLYRAARQRDTA